MLRARKHWKCSRCGKEIPVGSKYYALNRNYHAIIRRCLECKFASWENTSSDYLRTIGRLRTGIQCSERKAEIDIGNIIEQLEDLLDELEQSFWNVPDNLSYSPVAFKIEERKACVESVLEQLRELTDISSLEDIASIMNELV